MINVLHHIKTRLPSLTSVILAGLFAAAFVPALRTIDPVAHFSPAMADLLDQASAQTQSSTWILSQPGLFWQRLLGELAGQTNTPERWVIIAMMMAAGLLLASLARRRWPETPIRPLNVLLAGGLGASPLFFQPLLSGAPWVWGALVWFGCIRTLCRREGRADVQMEMVLGIALAGLVIVEPAATALVLGVVLGLPFILLRRPSPSQSAGLALIMAPPILLLVAQFISHLFIEATSVMTVAAQWTGGEAFLPDGLRPGSVVSPLENLSGFLPGILTPAVVLTPLLPMLGLGLLNWRTGCRPISLIIATGTPVVISLLVAWRTETTAYQPWLLYLLVGQAAWLLEADLSPARIRLLIGAFILWSGLAVLTGVLLR